MVTTGLYIYFLNSDKIWPADSLHIIAPSYHGASVLYHNPECKLVGYIETPAWFSKSLNISHLPLALKKAAAYEHLHHLYSP